MRGISAAFFAWVLLDSWVWEGLANRAVSLLIRRPPFPAPADLSSPGCDNAAANCRSLSTRLLDV
jgi:hypothetical protein